MIETGLTHTSEVVVGYSNTAMAVGSGDMPVFATPAMLALMENAAMLAVRDCLLDGCTTVGGYISSSHIRPTSAGTTVKAVAEVVKVEGKKISFKVAAYADDQLIGEGEHIRFIVEKEKFLSRL